MSNTKARLNRTQCRAVVLGKGGHYCMDHVRVMSNAVTETTNGKALMRVYPKKAQDVACEFLVRGSAILKAGREVPNKNSSDICVDAGERTVSYRTSKLSVVIEGALEKRKDADKQKYPPTDDVVAAHAKKKPSFQCLVAVNELGNILARLKSVGCEAVRLDLFSKTEALRFSAENDEAFVLGIIMPMVNNSGVAGLDIKGPPTYE